MPKLPIHQLPFFSSLIKDYLSQDKNLHSLYSFPPTPEGIKLSLDSKEENYSQRELLQIILQKNYGSIANLTLAEKENLERLKQDGFAVTTAHQPCLFMGPLYTITKAISTIALAQKLNKELGENKITPIYVIGSEDHDKDELLHTYLFGKKYEWQTEQQGSVGGMKIDSLLLQLLDEWMNSFGNLPFANELKEIYRSAYTQGNTITQSTQSILRSLFASYGLIVLDLNLPEVKAMMVSVFTKELENNFSEKTLKPQLDFIAQHYTVQAPPRLINLFEYKDGQRIRIDEVDASLIEKLKNYPEKFSPNVILRPLMQQMALPSIANIGGGAEVAYWLQLKPIFDIEKIDFPVILLRDIFSPIDEKSWKKWTNEGLNEKDFFLSIDDLKKKIVLQNSSLENDFAEIEKQLIQNFSSLETIISSIDKSLIGSYESELVKLKKSLEMLYGKMIKAEKRKNEDGLNSLEKIKNKIFEGNLLIERKENFSSYYLRYGRTWLENMIAEANPLDNDWNLQVME